MYLSAFAHRGLRPQKSKWAAGITPAIEYDTFCLADAGFWHDGDGNYWGIRDGGRTQLGQRGERLCKFPRIANDIDPWHGYPVSPLENGDIDCPADELVTSWFRSGIVSREIRNKILKHKL